MVQVFVHAHFEECVEAESEDQKNVQKLFLLKPNFLEDINGIFTIEIPDERYSVKVGLGDNESVDVKELGNPFGGGIAADRAINKSKGSI